MNRSEHRGGGTSNSGAGLGFRSPRALGHGERRRRLARGRRRAGTPFLPSGTTGTQCRRRGLQGSSPRPPPSTPPPGSSGSSSSPLSGFEDSHWMPPPSPTLLIPPPSLYLEPSASFFSSTSPSSFRVLHWLRDNGVAQWSLGACVMRVRATGGEGLT